MGIEDEAESQISDLDHDAGFNPHSVGARRRRVVAITLSEKHLSVSILILLELEDEDELVDDFLPLLKRFQSSFCWS